MFNVVNTYAHTHTHTHTHTYTLTDREIDKHMILMSIQQVMCIHSCNVTHISPYSHCTLHKPDCIIIIIISSSSSSSSLTLSTEQHSVTSVTVCHVVNTMDHFIFH